jgi:hypothetical protein
VHLQQPVLTEQIGFTLERDHKKVETVARACAQRFDAGSAHRAASHLPATTSEFGVELARQGHTHHVLVPQHHRMTPEAAPDDQDLWEHLYRSQEAVVIGLDDEQLTISQPAHATIVAGSSIGSPSAKITNFHGGTHWSLSRLALGDRRTSPVLGGLRGARSCR